MTFSSHVLDYLRRIGLDGRDVGTLTLEEIVAAHGRTIPFETFDLLLDVPVGDLSLAALTDKLVHRRRGGYCFEHDTLLGHVLRELGHDVEFLTGRVLLGDPDTPPPRTHQALLVTTPGVPGRRLVDVGFGGQTLSSPIDWDSTEVQPTRHEPYRLLPHPGGRALQALVRDEWLTLYVLGPEPQELVDLEVGSWYVSTHPDSGFRRGVRAAKVIDDARVTLYGTTLTVHHREHGTQHHDLGGADGVLATLGDEFGIPTDTPGLADAVRHELARVDG